MSRDAQGSVALVAGWIDGSGDAARPFLNSSPLGRLFFPYVKSQDAIFP